MCRCYDVYHKPFLVVSGGGRGRANLIIKCKFILFFQKEKKSLIEELETTKNQYGECNHELVRLQDIVERLQADKSKLSRRVSKLVHNGNSKNTDI